MRSKKSRAFGGEFLGTFLLVAVGCASVVQTQLGTGNFGSFLSINLSWGIAVALGICVSAGVSGAHLNPAVTLALAVHRKFDWALVPGYVLAQTAGAFFGAAAVYLTYHEALRAASGQSMELAAAGFFTTFPARHLSTFPGGLIDQTIATAILMLGVLALIDPRNSKWEKLGPILVGGWVVAIGMAFGYNCGYPINPARDLGPRFFTAIAGWGFEVFKAGNYWFWVPIVGPCLGAVGAGYLYDFFVSEKRAAT